MGVIVSVVGSRVIYGAAVGLEAGSAVENGYEADLFLLHAHVSSVNSKRKTVAGALKKRPTKEKIPHFYTLRPKNVRHYAGHSECGDFIRVKRAFDVDFGNREA